MDELHIILIERGGSWGQEFVERYAEHCRKAPAGAASLLSTKDNDLILWWAPDKPMVRSLPNSHLIQSEMSDEPITWQLLAAGIFGPDNSKVAVLVLDNEVLLHGVVQHQVRNRVNQLEDWFRKLSRYRHLILMFGTPDATKWVNRYQGLVRITHNVLVVRNEHQAVYLKRRDGAGEFALNLPFER